MEKKRLRVVRADEFLGQRQLDDLGRTPPLRRRPTRPVPTTPPPTLTPVTITTAPAGPRQTSRMFLLRLLVAAQSIFGTLFHFPWLNADIAKGLYRLIYDTDPEIAYAVYQGYLSSISPMGVGLSATGLGIVGLTLLAPRSGLVAFICILYLLSPMLLIFGAVVALIAVLNATI